MALRSLLDLAQGSYDPSQLFRSPISDGDIDGGAFVGSYFCSELLRDARVEHVVVHGSGDAAEVEIQTSGAKIAPNTQVVTGPDRIIVDFPGALPAAELHAFALKVNSGALREVRAGLFFNNPPITRIVLDLAEARSYQISTTHDGIVVKLGPATTGVAKLDSSKPALAKANSGKTNKATAWGPDSPGVTVVRTPRLQNALLATGTKAAPTRV